MASLSHWERLTNIPLGKADQNGIGCDNKHLNICWKVDVQGVQQNYSCFCFFDFLGLLTLRMIMLDIFKLPVKFYFENGPRSLSEMPFRPSYSKNVKASTFFVIIRLCGTDCQVVLPCVVWYCYLIQAHPYLMYS